MVDWNAEKHTFRMFKLVPAQVATPELVDGEIGDHQLLRDNLRDMARANRWLGANRAVVRRVARWVEDLPQGRRTSILDVATGGGDLPLSLRRWSLRHARMVALFASDVSAEVLAVARKELSGQPIVLLRHDALAMPFADSSVDIVICTQALHHFDQHRATQLLRELARVARIGVIVNDLRRSYLAYWGARLLACGPVSALSRHDGPLSVLRAYTPAEVRALVERAALSGTVRRAPGFRVEIELTRLGVEGGSVSQG